MTLLKFQDLYLIANQDDIHRNYLAARLIYLNRYSSEEDFLATMKYGYGISRKKARRALKAVSRYKDYYYPRNIYRDCFQSYFRNKQRYDCLKKGDDSTNDLISDFHAVKERHFTYTIPTDFLYKVLRALFDRNEEVEFAYYYTYVYFSRNSYKVESSLYSLYEYDQTATINLYSSSNQFNEFMSLFGLNTISQLIDIHVSVLLCLFNIYVEETITFLKFKYFDFVGEVSPLLKQASHDIDHKLMDILVRRYGFGPRERETLQSIADDYHISRERVRQKAKDAENKLTSYLRQSRYDLKACADYLFFKEDNLYLSFSNLNSHFGQSGIVFAIALINLFPGVYHTDEKYKALFLNEADKERIIQKKADKLPLVLPKRKSDETASAFMQSDDMDFFPEILRRFYRETERGYVRKGVRTSLLILDIIDEAFPLGYHITNSKHINYLRDVFNQRYPELTESFDKDRKVTTALSNNGYKLVDKGTYLNPLYTPKLPSQLINRIKSYLHANLHANRFVYYKTLQDVFKRPLERLGIENHYQLKGAIDEHIEGEFYVKRDFVTVREGATVKEAILKALQSNGGFMDETDLMKAINKNSLESLKITLYHYGRFLRLPNGKVVDKNTFYLTQNHKNVIVETINALMAANPVECTSIGQVYVSLKFNNREVLEGLPMIIDHKDFMKLLREEMKDKYYFGQKLISRDPGLISEGSVINAFLERQDSFTKEHLDSFISRMHLRRLSSFLRFAEQISDRFVQVEQHKFIRKDILESRMNDSLFKDFKALFDYILKEKKAIDTETFNGYRLLPSAPFEWNKYSLAGFIRSYFKHSYQVEATHPHYNMTEYIIKQGGRYHA